MGRSSSKVETFPIPNFYFLDGVLYKFQFIRIFCMTAVVSYTFFENFAREIARGRPKLIPSRMPEIWTLSKTKELKFRKQREIFFDLPRQVNLYLE